MDYKEREKVSNSIAKVEWFHNDFLSDFGFSIDTPTKIENIYNSKNSDESIRFIESENYVYEGF